MYRKKGSLRFRFSLVSFRFAVRPAAQREVNIQCAINAFALLLAVAYGSDRHRCTVQRGFDVLLSDRSWGVAVPVGSRFPLALVINAMLICTCAIDYMLLFCSARPINPLVEARNDAGIQPRHICSGDGDLQLRHICFPWLLMTDIQLGLGCVHFATYTFWLCCARPITPLDTTVSVVGSFCNVYAFASLRAADHLSGRGSTRC